ncbi:MAG: Ig-like domain-containing protein [Chitinophagales bacterium]|nr:Ig-like domain-containing protein [Chitinophagales bacterium]
MQKTLHLAVCALVAFSFVFQSNLLAQCDQPLAVSDFANTLQGAPVVINVQKNDTTTIFGQPVLKPLTTQIVTQPVSTAGTVSVLNNDSVVFTPDAGFLGITTFTYRVCNSCGCSNPVTVVVVVSNYCGAPLLADDNYIVYNNFNNKLNVLENDSFPAKIPFTITTTQPANGAVSVSGNYLNYLNSGTNTGVDSFEYTVCYTRSPGDTCPACATATVVLNTMGNCIAPTANDDNLQTVQGKKDTVQVLLNDDLHSFTLTGFSLVKLPANGSASILNNQIVYQANGTYAGTDTVLYSFCTPCGCDTAMLLISVAPAVCQKPIAVLDVAPTGFGTSCSFSFPVLKNDINPLNCGSLKLTQVVSQPVSGTAVTDTVLGLVTYTAAGVSLDTFVFIQYEVCNNAGCDTATLALFVGPYECNAYVPTLFNDQETVCNRDTVYLNVLKNDYDRDYGQKVSLKNIAGYGAHGDAYVVSDSLVMFIPNDTTYTGSDFFFYTACDDGNPTLCDIARVDLNIIGCYEPPVISVDGNPVDTIRVTFPEDSSVVLCFNVTDPNNDKTHIVSILGNLLNVTTADTVLTNDTTFCLNIVPPTNWNGVDTFSVVACDETKLCDTVVVIVTVTPVSDGIIAVNDTVTFSSGTVLVINQTANDIDEDGTGFSTTSVYGDSTTKGNIVLNGTGNIEYTVDSNFAGIDSFKYIICQPVTVNPRICDTATVYVTVPVKARNDNATTSSDKSVDVNLKNNDASVTGSYISLCSQAAHGTVEILDTFAGTIRYIPTAGYVGNDSFCYTLCGVIAGKVVCSNATVTVKVTELPLIEIPEGFSPNSDGKNDKFVIPNIDRFPKAELIVFNRWGDIVWRSPGEGYHNDFDGTWEKNNQPLPDGTYYYVLKLNDGKTKDIPGFVVINR